MPETTSRTSALARRGLAFVVLLVAAYVLLRIVVGVLSGIFYAVVVILALFAVVWAYRTVRRR